MAVYTDVSADDLTEFLSRYEIGELRSYKGIAEGVENSNFLVHTSAGNFILTLYEKRVAEKDLPFFLGLMEHLAARGITCPQPVKNRQGGVLGKLAGRPAAIVTFLDGLWIRRPNPGHCAAVGEALARLHLAGKDFPNKRANALSIESWRALYAQAKERGDSVRPGLCAEIAKELDALDKSWPRDLPDGVIHADLFPDNVFFLGDRLSGLIDFYFACTDTLAYDVAVCLNAWCFEPDHSYNVTKGRALLRSYANVRALSAAERAALPMLARGAAMRFLLTRLVDWLAVPDGALVKPKDPLEYFRKLRFHQSVKSAHDPTMAESEDHARAASPSTPTAPAPAIRARAAGARSLTFGDHEKELNGGEPHTTNNRMELMAAISALETLKRPCSVDLYTDSEYMRGGITGWINGWKKNGWRTADKKPVKNVDLWKRLDAALGHHEVRWHWVKGHAGHAMNERADELARDGLVAARAGAIGAMKSK